MSFPSLKDQQPPLILTYRYMDVKENSIIGRGHMHNKQ